MARHKPHDTLFRVAFADPDAVLAWLRQVANLPALSQAVDGTAQWFDVGEDGPRPDLVLSVRLRTGEALVFVDLEAQATYDASMPLRCVVYLGRILERWRAKHAHLSRRGVRPVALAIVLHHGATPWPRHDHARWFAPRDVQHSLAGRALDVALTVLDLAAQPSLGDVARADLAFAMRLLGCPGRGDALDVVLSSQALLREAVSLRDPSFADTVLGYVSAVTTRGSDMSHDALTLMIRQVARDGAPEGSYAAKWLAEGREEGREEGLEAGREEGRRLHAQRTVLRLATQRLGAPDAAQVARVEAMTEAQADAALSRLFEATDWASLLHG